jgi:TatD DNase family protein
MASMDFHCHLDLYPNAKEVYLEAARRNEFTWLVTTSPKAFVATSRVLGTSRKILITPGLHPEIAHERAGELDLLLQQMENSPAVGEVGLDGSPRYRSGYEVQTRIFRSVLRRCVELGGKVLSIHSRQAGKEVLAELKQHRGYGTAILHWFTGTPSELRTADEQGCWFSIGPAAFVSANGRSIATKLPRDRVVPESDGPFAKVGDKPVLPWSADATAKLLAQTWLTSHEDALLTLTRNSNRLVAIIRGG